MPNNKPPPATTNRVLVKLRPSAALRAAESRGNLRPLYEPPPGAAAGFGLGAEPQWFLADLPDGAATPWDLAHARVADQLGVDGSDVVFVEPDIIHTVFQERDEAPEDVMFAAGVDCSKQIEQTDANGQKKGPDRFAWHLEDEFSQLGRARDQVPFTDPRRTRIAHIDTGCQDRHVTRPAGVLKHLERNFVKRDGTPDDAEDPNNRVILVDNSGHGTGTLGILAGAAAPTYGSAPIGGAPGAEVVPLRVADRVVLFYTSVFSRALRHAVDVGCDVVTMSMGGLPMRSWREEIDRAYEAGVCIVSAAGNNFGGAPTRNIVYPARYARVIAACGVMADHTPYHDLRNFEMQGNYGPSSVMGSALSAYTPNIPWALFGCETMLRLNGGGTSSATPQIAAAAALWYEKYKNFLPRNWRRVEAVRNALFASARQVPAAHRAKLGRGILQAADALTVEPDLELPKTKSDSDSFAFLRVLTGLGMVEVPPREEMFNLEFMQRWLLNEELQEIVPDPDAVDQLSDAKVKKLMEALIEDHGASLALRKHMVARYPMVAGRPAPRTPPAEDVVPAEQRTFDTQPTPGNPANRRLRVFAVDPSLSGRLETAGINEVTLSIRWEDLRKGPVGEYLNVQDVDPTGERYEGVDLNDPRLLARDGWAPSEGNAQFHQQMVYAVAMKTIEHFERALGRPVLWRPKRTSRQRVGDGTFVPQLLIRPHALRQANAYYSPQEVALLFGYFEAAGDDPGRLVPGSRVYSCLSHDIIVHETTHAILDGMQRRFNEPSNPDVLALHEGFADIIALMQHFTLPELLEAEIARTRGDIEAESILGSLAVQFGQALGRGGALREAIGRIENGVWRRLPADPAELQKRQAPHSRGAILVAAVFDAFIAIYRARTADLLRIYTGGTGILPSGAIHPDLVSRLAGEAARSASHVLNMCIRALDYLPPVDVTFFEYLRALITADYDLVREDRYNYRVAFVEAFRQRGIYPANLGQPGSDAPRSLSVDTLRWQGLDQVTLAARAELSDEVLDDMKEQYKEIVEGLKRYADACFYLEDRENLFTATCEARRKLEIQLKRAFKAVPALAAQLGLDTKTDFEVQELRRAMRVAPDGKHIPQIVVSLTQEVEHGGDEHTPRFTFRGGSTLVVDLTSSQVKYRIVKNIDSPRRQERTADFVRSAAADPLRALFLAPDRREPFAALHTLAEDGR